MTIRTLGQVGTPAEPNDIANKAYVDSAAGAKLQITGYLSANDITDFNDPRYCPFIIIPALPIGLTTTIKPPAGIIKKVGIWISGLGGSGEKWFSLPLTFELIRYVTAQEVETVDSFILEPDTTSAEKIINHKINNSDLYVYNLRIPVPTNIPPEEPRGFSWYPYLIY